MNASRVHAVIAAGLENPALLSRWRREPESLRGCGIDPGELDLEALWKFAGLTAKVRHNGLRAELPLTFRLLNVAELEIEVFASYASFRATEGGRYANTVESRTQDLLAFLERWLDFDKREHALVWDMIRYELALTRLSKLAVDIPASLTDGTRSEAVARAASVPSLRGEVILHEMRSDPRIVRAMLQEKSPRLDEVPLGKYYFSYWRASAAAEMHILQLDELGFYLLSLIDGKRSAADLSRMTGGSRRPPKSFLKALDQLAGIGIVSFDGRQESENRSQKTEDRSQESNAHSDF